MTDIVNKYLDDKRADRKHELVYPRMICKDGFTMSVQAGPYAYCAPRDDYGPYVAVEIGFPSQKEYLLMEWAENEENPTRTVYANVPVNVVIEVINKHGGLVEAHP